VRAERPPKCAVAVAGAIEVFVFLEEGTDLDKLKGVLQQRSTKLEQAIAQVDGKLGNANFVSRADPEVVAGERSRRDSLAIERELLVRNLAGF
jgi:valyl-tRNA synthetase